MSACKYTTSVDIQKHAIKITLVAPMEGVSAVSLLKSEEQHYIKALNNNQQQKEQSHSTTTTTTITNNNLT